MLPHQFSSVNRTMANFCFHIANVGHNFNKFCLQTQRKQAEEQLKKVKDQEAMAESEIEQLKKALQPPPQPQPQPQPQSQPHTEPANNPSLTLNNPAHKARDDILTIAFQHFTNEFKPTILSRYPTAPADKVKKVIEQKWNSIDSAKKEAYIKKVMRKIEAEKTKQKQQETSSQSQFQPQLQTETKPQAQEQQQHEVLVKQQAQQQEPEPREDKFNQFLNRVNQNVKAMQEEHLRHKQEQVENTAMEQEPSQPQQQTQPEEEAQTQKMQEQSD